MISTSSSSSSTYYIVDTSIYGSTVIYVDQYGYLVDPTFILAYPTNYVVTTTASLYSTTIFVDLYGVVIYPDVIYVYSYTTYPADVSVYYVSENELESTMYID